MAAPRSPRSRCEQAQADVHVRRAARRSGGLTLGEVESVAIGALRIAEPAHGQLQVGQRDGAAEDVGDVALEPEPADGLGVGGLRGREVTLTPRGQPHQGGGGTESQVVVGG